MNGPVIEGEKVRLRPHVPEDAEAYVGLLANPEVTRYLARQEPFGLQQERDWIEARAKDPDTLGWTIEVAGRCVGNVGFDEINWRNGSATVGIFIGDPELWGQGITTEVAQIIARYAFLSLPLRKLKSGYLEPNEASGKAQSRIGLCEVGRWHAEYFRDGQWVDHVNTELMRDEWVAAQVT